MEPGSGAGGDPSGGRSRRARRPDAAASSQPPQQPRPASRFVRLRAWAVQVRPRAEARFPLITHFMEQLVSVNVLDSATRLAAQTFLTAVPLLFVVASVAPDELRDQFVSSLEHLFGLSGAAQSELDKVLQQANGPSDEVRQTTGVVSGLMVLISATACSRAMQRLCERAWSLPKAGVRVAAWRWVAWLVAWLVMIGMQGSLLSGFGAGETLGVVLLFGAEVALWWWTQHLLLTARVPWLPLLPGALLTGAALSVLSATASLYVPRVLNHSLDTYGSLGAVFTLLSWLITLCAVVTLCVTAGAVLAREPWVARSLGTPPKPPPPVPGRPPSPPPPPDHPRPDGSPSP